MRYTYYCSIQIVLLHFIVSQPSNGTPHGTPMRKLTDAFVKTLAAPQKERIEVRDAEIPGFALRVTEKGAKSWILIYQLRGRKCRLTLGSYPDLSLAEARKRARQHRGEVERGEDPAASKRSARAAQTVGEAAAVYIERYAKPNKRTWTADEWAFRKYILPYWRDRKLREIQRVDVINLLERVAKTAPVFANRIRALLSKFFSFSVSQALCEVNPVRDAVRLTKETPREFSLTPAQIRAVWKGIGELENQRLKDFYQLAFLTCARRGELLRMTWSEIDLNAALWSLPPERVKNGRAWRVPLPPTAVAILRERKRHAGESALVFADETGGLLKRSMLEVTHTALVKELGIPFRLHDARSVIVTHLSEQGTPADVLDRLLNHVTSGITAKHYNRYNREPEHRRALLRWDNWLQGIVEPRGEVVQFPSVAVAS
jgi:integrase